MRCRSAQQHQEESHQWKSARRLRRFFFSFRSSPDVCSEVIYLRAFQRGCPLARVFRAFPGTLPARPLFIRVFEAPVRKSFIHAGFRVAARKRPTYGGFRGDTEKRTVYAGLRACPSAYSITTKHTTPLGAAAGAGRLGRNMFEHKRVIKPAAKRPAARSLLRLGSRFFADFLWRGKESQRGALPLSATASREVSWGEGRRAGFGNSCV